MAGFVGPLCEKNVDECEFFPCANGGSCEDLINDFKCKCALGFTGKDCTIKKHEVKCADNPCQNNGTCTDLNNDYRCSCGNGFHGKNCQYPVNVFDSLTNVSTTTENPRTSANKTTLPNNGSFTNMQQNSDSDDSGSGVTMMQLVLIVCLGAGIPLVIIIIIIIVLLLHKKHSFPHMQKERAQNVVNNMNNKVVDSNIFTTIPSTNIKIKNEDQDFNAKKSRHSQIYLEKCTNRQYTKECNINPYSKREPLHISQSDLPQKSLKNIDLGTYSADSYSTDSYSAGNSSHNLDSRYVICAGRVALAILEY